MRLSSTHRYLHEKGEKDGVALGLAAGWTRQLCKLLLRHGNKTWAPATPEQRDWLHTLADRSGRAEFEQLLARFLQAKSWDELLTGLSLPAAPVQPDYVMPPDFEINVASAAYDQYAAVSTKSTGERVVLHVRIQKQYQPELGRILYEQNRRVEELEGKKVQFTAVMLLWPGADGPDVTGEYRIPKGGVYRYAISRLWEKNVDEILVNPAMVIFAPLSNFPAARLPSIVTRVIELIRSESDKETRDNFWKLLYWTMGLRYSADEVNAHLAPVLAEILALDDFKACVSGGFHHGFSRGQNQGILEATRTWVLTLGTHRLGDPTPALCEAIASLNALDRLEQLSARVLKEADWPSVMRPS